METVETARLGSVLGESTGGKGWAKEEERERRGGRAAGKEAEGKEAEGRRGGTGGQNFLHIADSWIGRLRGPREEWHREGQWEQKGD